MNSQNRVVVIIDGGVAYVYNDPSVKVLTLDMDNTPEITEEDIKDFEDLIPSFVL
jgi:hypothetical protein